MSISSISTNTGAYNTSVVIYGTGFSTVKSEDKVSFNGKQATITAASGTSLTATVPLGAGTGNVSVTVNGNSTIGPVFNYVLSYVVSTFAGNGTKGNQDGSATNASFYTPSGLAFDKAGNLFVTDEYYGLVRKIDPAGAVTTFAGGAGGPKKDGTGTSASFGDLTAITFDSSGNIFVSDYEGLISKITPGAVATTFINGEFVPGYSFEYPSGLAIDASGNLYVSIYRMNQIHKITPGGVVTNFAGSGAPGSLDGKPGNFWEPAGLVFDPSGLLCVADFNNNKIRSVDLLGTVSTIAAFFHFNNPNGLAVDSKGNIYVSGNNEIVVISADHQHVNTIAGTVDAGSNNGDGKVATFNNPTGLAVDASGNIYVADTGNNTIRKIALQ
ncbi:SBBP repeat-containing protein [Mucilaginibacter sp. OK098]|uniref:SBBP repeat-containing protein n=1 Tax=Mucilaginibacter sp. OK098 TaxID=1855297 RepID=UPI0013563AF6|nr:SBBP repeat-containing protein [Mucilaginibacter sp. OK098]